MTRTVAILLWCILISMGSAAHAQTTDSTANTDSLASNFITDNTRHMQELEVARLQDSIKKDELQHQIDALKTTDNVKKEELLQELAQMKNKEALRIEAKKRRIDSLRNLLTGYPVVPFLHDTLFVIYSKMGSLSPRDRADAITNRIKKLAGNYFFNPDSLAVSENENTIDLVFRESIVISISENDAIWQNTSAESLAAMYKERIGRAVARHRKATSWQTILKQVGLSVLAVAVLFALIFAIGRLFRYTKTKIEAQENILIKGISIRNYELFDVKSQLRFYLRINTALKWVIILSSVYLTLPVIFSIFPWTEGFAETLFSYFLSPIKKILSAIWHYLPNFFTIVVIVLVFRYILKGISFIKNEIARGALSIPGFYPDWAAPTFQIIRILLLAFMFILVFPYLPGSDSPVFKGVSVFLGVLFTFGSSGSLSNIIAGLVLTYMRAFKIGDRVKIGDVTGDIIEKTLLVTRVRTIKNEIISIPNSNVMNSHTVNYSSDAPEKGLIMHTTITIGYDVPWKEVHMALITAAGRTEYLLKDPGPFVLQTGLEDFYVSYQINAYTRDANKQAAIYSQLHQHIQDCCNEAGIEILSPHYRAARDGNHTTIPVSYLPHDYTSPGFKVDNNTGDK